MVRSEITEPYSFRGIRMSSSIEYLHDIVSAHVPSGADGCSVLVGNVAGQLKLRNLQT